VAGLPAETKKISLLAYVSSASAFAASWGQERKQSRKTMLPPLLLLTASAATGSTPSLRRLISRRPLLSAGAAAALGWSINAGRPRVYATVADIPDDEFRRHATLRCRVVKVSDGDTLRCEHEPLWSALIPSAGGPKKGKLSARSLSVRLYAIDAPETAKAGRPGQPLGGAATAFVSAAVLGKLVQVSGHFRDTS